MWLKRIIKSGKVVTVTTFIHSEQIKLLIENDETNPRKAVDAFQRLKQEKVNAIIAATWDFTTSPLMPLAKEAKIPLMVVATRPEAVALETSGGYGFGNGINAHQEAKAFDEFLSKEKIGSVGILYINNPWGQAGLREYRNVANEKKVKVVIEEPQDDFALSDWKDVIARIKKSAPELLVLLISADEIELFLRQAREQKLSMKFFGGITAYEAFYKSKVHEKYESVCMSYPFKEKEIRSELTNKLIKKFGDYPEYYNSGNAYDAVGLLANAYFKESHNDFPERVRMLSYKGLMGEYRYSDKESFSRGVSSLGCILKGEIVE